MTESVTARDRQRGSHLPPLPSPSGLTRMEDHTDLRDRFNDTVQGNADKRERDENRQREGAREGLRQRNEVEEAFDDREGRSSLPSPVSLHL